MLPNRPGGHKAVQVLKDSPVAFPYLPIAQLEHWFGVEVTFE